MPQLSAAVTDIRFTEGTDEEHATPVFAGHVMEGTSLSLTVTVKEQLALPQLLAAVTVTLVVPLLNTEPLPVPVPLLEVAPEKEYDNASAGVPEAVAV